MQDTITAAVARINGTALAGADEDVTPEELRRRACTELLRQAATAAGLLAPDDARSADGAVSVAAAAAIEKLVEERVAAVEPAEEACRRYYDAHHAAFRTGERVRARHVLFAVTAGVDVTALRRQAESALLALRAADGGPDAFARAAAAFSNCPTAAHGGDLGWLSAGDCAPEFASEIFGRSEVGVLPRLVHTRYGLHVVEVLEREAGVLRPYEDVRAAVATTLQRHAFVNALRGYLRTLAAAAHIEGVDLEHGGA